MRKRWEIKKLGEVCSIGDGNYSSKYPKAEEFVSEGVPFLTATNLKNGTIVNEGIRFITKGQHSALTKGHVIKNDLVIVVRGSSTGNNSIVPTEYEGSNLNSQLAFLRIKNNSVDSRYLFIVFNSPNVQKVVLNTISGAAQPQLPNNKLLNIEIPVPPLPEQKRIVAILDEAFAAIAKAKSNAERNLKNARQVFESYLQGVFENRGEDWEEKALGEICEYVKTPHDKSDLPYVGLEDIQSNSGLFIGSFESKTVKSTTFKFTSEHVLYGRLRPYLNKVLLPNFEGHCSTEIFPIKPNKNLLDRTYLFHWLISNDIMKKINATWTGATLPRANMNAVLEFKLLIPPLQSQQTIVQKLGILKVETQKLETIYQQKINDLDELKKSVLQKAFSGELKTEKELA